MSDFYNNKKLCIKKNESIWIIADLLKCFAACGLTLQRYELWVITEDKRRLAESSRKLGLNVRKRAD